jgi:hypothetical protein
MISRILGALVVRVLILYKMGNTNGEIDSRDENNIASFRLPVCYALIGRLPLLFYIT